MYAWVNDKSLENKVSRCIFLFESAEVPGDYIMCHEVCDKKPDDACRRVTHTTKGVPIQGLVGRCLDRCGGIAGEPVRVQTKRRDNREQVWTVQVLSCEDAMGDEEWQIVAPVDDDEWEHI
tara:strand:- start:676 stop:1038 length:363 start_codon:yes stop_codon:yes gene_type:complete